MISTYQYTYDAAGNQDTKTDSKGTTTYTYDENNRLSSVTEPEGKVTSYLYDKAGNRRLEQVEYGLVSTVTVYSYDECGRLTTTISSDGTETRYLYDPNGNLTSRSVGKMEIVSPEELSEVMLPNFDLIINKGDASGTGSDKLTIYSYDCYNRLKNLKTGNSTTAYSYNAQGYRVEKKLNNKTTRYLYEYDKVVLETDGSNNQTAYQVYGTNLLFRSASGEAGSGTQSYYYLYNAHRDVTSLLDMSGNIAVSYDYDAFGNIKGQTGTADNPIRYAGYQYDEESGLYYLNARYYDSVTARFITEDTYTGQAYDPLSLNLYTYCANNPVIYFDPTGHWKASDNNLNDDAKGEMLSLTVAYHNVDTAAEKEAIHDQMLAIRADKDNYGDKDTLVEINNESAFDKYMLKAIKNGKVSDKELEKALSLIDATTAASTDIYHPSGGSALIVTDTTTTIGKTDISVYTSALKTKDTDKVLATCEMDVTNHYAAYVFYLPEWKDEMVDAKNTLASYYGIDKDDIGTASVRSTKELSYAWNSIGYTESGNNVSAVVIDTHASPTTLGYGESNSPSMDTNQISNLENKYIDNLVLYGCNAGHLDYKDTNVAAMFSQKINEGKVLASDGTVGYGTRDILWVFGNKVYTSNNDSIFKKYLTENSRKNTGFIIYQYNEDTVSTSDGLGKSLTLKQMLNKMK